MGEWELFALSFSTTVLDGAGLRNQQKDEQRGSKGDMEGGKWSPSGLRQKKKIAAELHHHPHSPHPPAIDQPNRAKSLKVQTHAPLATNFR